MSASASVIEETTLLDRLANIIDKPPVHMDEINSVLEEEFHKTLNPRAIEQLTDLRHLTSFIETREFTNHLLALQVCVDKNTSIASKKALINAIIMIANRDDKSYELICHLAQQNKLERFTEISSVTPLRIYQDDGNFVEYSEWYLLFDLFSLSQVVPQELIKEIADWIITKEPAVLSLAALRHFLHTMSGSIVVHSEVFEQITPYLHNERIIEKIELLFMQLQHSDLLKLNVLIMIIPLLDQVEAISSFLSIFQHELLQKNIQEGILGQLPLYCQMAHPSMDSYDDKVPSNTPLHQSIIERNIKNLILILAFTNSRLLTTKSYENTALLLACKLADEKAAMMILNKMHELGCDVNQQDSHGMSALHWASFYHFDDLITELKAAGANDKLHNTNGQKSSYFYHHKFTISDFKRELGEIIEGTFKLNNAALTDLCFHMDKIALNLRLTTKKDVEQLYHSDQLAQLRSANRFLLFFNAFRSKLINWLEQQNAPSAQPLPNAGRSL